MRGSRRPARTATARWSGCIPGSTPAGGDLGHVPPDEREGGEEVMAQPANDLG